MTKVIDINIKRTGFPVGFSNPDTGERVELWFDSSIESMKKYLDLDKLALEKYKKVKAAAAKFSESLDGDRALGDHADVTEETVDAAIDFNKGLIAVKYDLLFGDGSFDKIYDVFPDFEALESNFYAVDQAIANKIKQDEFARKNQANKIRNQYNKKKKHKKK
ncbi:hypothetical protein A5886_001802 [Enterococcus sp. 8G7_MSG3316]|uniref:Uncharacterized protein n=1 Tax=Candidatus Enterococcus testudinis TaxID=1834191 RepID=A0A242A7Y5_9ENTE|nr:hypothetical protein [Enterococcus sp. 8G7_MSG3316]OTN76723.1 hypothetical protein A5886_001802 [Enterococcus sp. 8G7_MSG3316]